MLTNGATILSQQIIFSETSYGLGLSIGVVVLGFFFLVFAFEEGIYWAIVPGVIGISLFIAFMGITCTKEEKTFLNKPSKIEYTVEITDDNAWKEIGPRYIVKEKIFENKEIYVIEGDYIEEVK